MIRQSKALFLALGVFLFALTAAVVHPAGSAQAQTPEPVPETLTIVKVCVGGDDETFTVDVDFVFEPDVDEAPDPLVDEDDDFDIDDQAIACGEQVDLVEADMQALFDWWSEFAGDVVGSAVSFTEDAVAGVTPSYSGCVGSVEELISTGIVCVITNTFATNTISNENTNVNDINIPIDITNENKNALNNDNLNDNNNQNSNTQEQSNEQKQINDNNQTTNVDSSPSVNITGIPKPVKPTAKPPTSSPPDDVKPPSTGEGLHFVAPPATGDGGLLAASDAGRSGGGYEYLIVLSGVVGALALAGAKFSGARD